MGVTATDSNPRQLHGINDAPTKPTNLPRPKAYLTSIIGFCRQKILPNSAAKLLAHSCSTRLAYKLSNGQQSQCVGDGFKLSNPKLPSSLNSTIGRERYLLWIDFHPNLALKKGATKPNYCQDNYSLIQSTQGKHQAAPNHLFKGSKYQLLGN